MSRKKSLKDIRIRNSTTEFLVFSYQSGGDGVNVLVQGGTVWLSQKNMGLLFDTSSDNIGLHMKNIFKDEELLADSVTEDFSVTTTDGKYYSVKHYNLDAIIAVGYRVNSRRATAHAESEFEKYRVIQDKLFESDFDRQLKLLEEQASIGNAEDMEKKTVFPPEIIPPKKPMTNGFDLEEFAPSSNAEMAESLGEFLREFKDL